MTALIASESASHPSDPVSFLSWWDSFKSHIMYEARKCWRCCQRKIEHSKSGLSSDYTSHWSNESAMLSLDRKPIPKIPPRIKVLKEENGSLVSDPEIIMDKIFQFYSGLYDQSKATSPPQDMNFGLKRVLIQDEEDQELHLSLEDLHNAATIMNLGKAPGCDGITLEFYLFFWQWLGPLILKWVSCSMAVGKLSGMAAVGVISLVPKAGDSRLLTNWRPISLLTVELKIALKALTNKIIPFITPVITQHQTSIPGASIFTSLSIIRDSISIYNARKQPLWLLSLDQEKAFDHVSHQYLFHLLKVIGLPDYLYKGLKTMYSGFSCVVRNMSKLSKPFPYRKGIRQGDPTSTILFALASQPLVNILNLAMYSEGCLLPHSEPILCTAYADDFTIFLRNLTSVKVVVDCFATIALYSGAVINIQKSTLFGLNIPDWEVMVSNAYSCGIPVTFHSLKILGIVFTANLKIHTEQWNAKIDSTRLSIAANTQRLINSSYFQRASWAKSKLWPRWSFLLKVLQPNKVQLTQLSSLFSEVIWLGAKHWMSLKYIAAPLSAGGLAALNPVVKIQVLRVMMLAKFSLMKKEAHCFNLASHILKSYAGMGLGFELLHSFSEHKELASLPSVYSAALTAWDDIPICFFPKTKNDLLDMPVFSSRFLLQAHNPVSISITRAKALKIVHIKDLYNLTPISTRNSCRIISDVRQAVDQYLLPDVIELVGNTPGEDTNQNGVPSFHLLLENSTMPIGKWSNSLIAATLQCKLALIRTPQVPSNTWKILVKACAPPLFVNQAWRFFHSCTITPRFLLQIGLLQKDLCLLCGEPRCTKEHQFQKCPSLRLAIDMMAQFADHLGLPPLLNQDHLYPDPSEDHKLANFIVLAFIYSVVLVSRSAVKSNITYNISPERFKSIFMSVIAKHIEIFAITHPPEELRYRRDWRIYTHRNLIARFCGDQLHILYQDIFKPYTSAGNHRTG